MDRIKEVALDVAARIMQYDEMTQKFADESIDLHGERDPVRQAGYVVVEVAKRIEPIIKAYLLGSAESKSR